LKKVELLSKLQCSDLIKDIKEPYKNDLNIQLKERANYVELLKLLNNYEIIKIKELEPSLEDIFLKFY